jgi:formylglycine-generating enzyme required for sulfatase activity
MSHLPRLTAPHTLLLTLSLSAAWFVASPSAEAENGRTEGVDRQGETDKWLDQHIAGTPSASAVPHVAGLGEPARAAPLPAPAQTSGGDPRSGDSSGLETRDGTVPAGKTSRGQMGYEMVAIPAGTYELGCTAGQSRCEDNETPHTVTLSHGYAMGRTEVTQGLWLSVVGSNPAHFTACGPTCPVEQVSWAGAAKFANALSARENLQQCYKISGSSVSWSTGLACTGYRLPTEAEWEVAARGGQDVLYAGGAQIGTVAWVRRNARTTTHPVAQKAPNGYGLYDMSGNVWEWVWDWYGRAVASSTDPIGPPTGSHRVRRGGSYLLGPSWARVSTRLRSAPADRRSITGFRLARTIP